MTLEPALSEGVLETLSGLPCAQDTDATAVTLGGLLQLLLLADATVAVADWTPEAKARLIEILQLYVPLFCRQPQRL